MRISDHFHINSFAFNLALNRGFGQLENDLIFLELNSFKIYQNKKNCFRETPYLVTSCHSRAVTAKKSKCTEKRDARAELFLLILRIPF